MDRPDLDYNHGQDDRLIMTYTRYTPTTVLITGATGGFGEAFAKRFAADGCKLIIHGRNKDKVDALINVLNTDCHPLIFNVMDREATLSALDSLPADFQNIDLLINNAGGALGMDKAQDANLEDWEAMIEMNNTSLVRITRKVLDIMVSNKKGHIINIGSIAGNYGYPGGHVYCAAKAFTNHFSLALRSDLDGTNIRVTSIEPGMVQTQFSLVRFKGDSEKADAVYEGANPLLAEDIAETVYWTATLPEHVNINSIEVMPTSQSCGPLQVHRKA